MFVNVNGTEVNTAHVASVKLEHRPAAKVRRDGKPAGEIPESFIVWVKLGGGQSLQQTFSKRHEAEALVAKLKA
jgi:hypothetical protein